MNQPGIPIKDFCLKYYCKHLPLEEDVGYITYYDHFYCPMIHWTLEVILDSSGKKTLKETKNVENFYHGIRNKGPDKLVDHALKKHYIFPIHPSNRVFAREIFRQHFMIHTQCYRKSHQT